ncbi:HNH endonuclease [Bradyrhizobium sp. SEMIA]|uniref:HNH endonuclease n=1 Tax=Bradyrhizobium sp. SEMIA TaxID=2597515 RepID=UPI0018A400FE|nr:endonuclease [Bradyrhizobium sp. SEMIA]
MTKLQRLKLAALKQQKGRCHYCRSPLSIECATADHKWPQCRRGRTWRGNIVAACQPCNGAKGSMPYFPFMKLITRGFPRGAPARIIVIWSSRRIWMRAHRACAAIRVSAA